jgi:mannosyltransferase
MMAYTAWLERRRAWTGIALAVSSALAYLTHYFALFLPLVQFLHLAIHLHTHPRALRRWVGIQLAAAVPFAVWVLALLRREGQFFGIGWIPTPRLSDLLGTLVNFIVGYTGEPRWWQVAAVLVGLALAALGIGRAWRVRQAKSSTLLWAAAPALIAFALSMRRPVYMDRFLILSLPAVLLLIASGVRALPRRLKRPGALAVLGATAIAAASFFRPAPTREQWREAAARLEGAGRHEAIIVRVLQIVVPLSYYYEGSPPLRALEVNREVASLSALAAGHEGTWLVYWNASADIHRPAASPAFRPEDENDPEAAAWLSGRGPSLVERFDYVGVTVLHFGAQP